MKCQIQIQINEDGIMAYGTIPPAYGKSQINSGSSRKEMQKRTAKAGGEGKFNAKNSSFTGNDRPVLHIAVSNGQRGGHKPRTKKIKSKKNTLPYYRRSLIPVAEVEKHSARRQAGFRFSDREIEEAKATICDMVRKGEEQSIPHRLSYVRSDQAEMVAGIGTCI